MERKDIQNTSLEKKAEGESYEAPFSNEESKLRINKWIRPSGKNFSYRIYWPYADGPLKNDELVDVHIKLDFDSKFYVGTFTTINDLERRFKRYKENGDCVFGTYQPLANDNQILLQKICHNSVEITIEHLLSEKQFYRYFEEVHE